VGFFLLHTAYLWFTHRLIPDTDILALLPLERHDAALSQAFNQIVGAAQQRIIVLVGSDDWARAARAADHYLAALKPHGDLLEALDYEKKANGTDLPALLQRHRTALITEKALTALETQPRSYWIDSALRQLYQPFSGFKTVSWQDDPFGLFADWLQERAEETPVRPRDGWLSVTADRRQYVLLTLELRAPAFSVATHYKIVPLLDEARRAARKVVPGAEIITGGIVLHAAAASAQAQAEISTIGVGSTIGIVLLIWWAFRSVKPILWIALSLGVGCLGAISICALVFDRIHLLTLVFGASLIGVAEDYGIYYLCHRGAERTLGSMRLWRRLLPPLVFTLVTTLIGYMALALTPFPGLRQMALFSMAGLICAWLTVAFWFPFLIAPGSIDASRAIDRMARALDRWPRWRRSRRTLIGAGIFAVCVAYGLSAVKAQDDIRVLQNPPRRLLADQIKLSRILDAPSPAQFYLVRGASADLVLDREESLKQQLDPLIDKRVFTGYQAISNWVPSQGTQERHRSAVERGLLGKNGALKALAGQLGEDDAWVAAMRGRFLAASAPLSVDYFLRASGAEPWRHLWLGRIGSDYASVVALRGITPASLPALRDAASGLKGILWVDKVGNISALLADYRRYMSWVVIFSYVGVYLLLVPRYRGRTWRVLAPAALASIGTVALFGITGVGLQLFHVLALMLLLGIGVDYGIFFQEHPTQRDPTAWLATVLSSVSTLLSFGLLALSKTPALRAFGLTLLIGITTVALIVPCFASEANSAQKPAAPKD